MSKRTNKKNSNNNSNGLFSKKTLSLFITIIAAIIAFFQKEGSNGEKPNSAQYSPKSGDLSTSSSSINTTKANTSVSTSSSSSIQATSETSTDSDHGGKDTMTIVKMPYNNENKYDLEDLASKYWNVISDCKVESVYDADTIHCIYNKNGKQEKIKIRMLGIDAPEAKQMNGAVATKYLDKTIKGKNLALIHEKNTDRYGRVLGTLYYNGKNINQELISKGFVFFYPQTTKRDNESKLFLGYKKDFLKACTTHQGIFKELTVDSNSKKIPSTPKQYRDSKSKENWQNNYNPVTDKKFQNINELCTYWTMYRTEKDAKKDAEKDAKDAPKKVKKSNNSEL